MLLLLLAFISQTLAMAAMTCKQEASTVNHVHAVDMGDSHHDHMNHSSLAMEHEHHEVNATRFASDNSAHVHQTSDCCKTMSHCVLGGCTLVAATNDADFLLLELNSAVEDFYSDVAPTPLISSLYRPPIFC